MSASTDDDNIEIIGGLDRGMARARTTTISAR